uniref:Uncharacterized protein n=1 Tax=Micrurus corallinus TaxID=54390 RepID=A0A2D4GEZ8_MICCO
MAKQSALKNFFAENKVTFYVRKNITFDHIRQKHNKLLRNVESCTMYHPNVVIIPMLGSAPVGQIQQLVLSKILSLPVGFFYSLDIESFLHSSSRLLCPR